MSLSIKNKGIFYACEICGIILLIENLKLHQGRYKCARCCPKSEAVA